MKKEPTNLQKALAVLLYDQFDCPDVEAGFDDDIMVDYIISAMIDCGAESEFVWKEFIGINNDTL